MVLWRGTVEYTPVLTGKRVWEIVEVEAPTLEAAIQKALLKTGIGPIRRQLTHVKVDIGKFSSGTPTYEQAGIDSEPPLSVYLEKWLTDKGLSLLDAEDIISGIPDFLSTTLALDERGMIVDYDQYYADPEYVKVNWGRAIWQRLQHEAREGKIRAVDRLLIYKNVAPDRLEYHGTISPYI